MSSDERAADDVLVYEPSKVSWVTAEFVRRPPAWMARAFIFCLGVMILVLVGYSAVAEVAIHVDARGALTTEPRMMPVIVDAPFRVAKIHVREQEEVEKGALLIEAEDEADAELDRLRTHVKVAQSRNTPVDPTVLADIQALEARKAAADARRDVIAPVSGIVHHIAVSGEGQFIAKGTEVLEIIPKGAEFVAELAVANKDISQVSVGLPVIIRLDAFPERTHGTINGKVESIPLSLTPSGDPTVPPAYLVTVKLDRQSFTKGKQEYKFRSGMQLDGRMVTRHESMLSNFLHKLFSISED